jgi:hypothetical protein
VWPRIGPSHAEQTLGPEYGDLSDDEDGEDILGEEGGRFGKGILGN